MRLHLHQDAAVLDEQEGAEVADPVAEQRMVRNVLESLVRDEAADKAQVIFGSCTYPMHPSIRQGTLLSCTAACALAEWCRNSVTLDHIIEAACFVVQVEAVGRGGAAGEVGKAAGSSDEAGAASKQPSAKSSESSKAEPAKVEKGSKDTAGEGQAGLRDSSHTVFVRALPPDVSQDQLHLAFKKFGKLRACRFDAAAFYFFIVLRCP